MATDFAGTAFRFMTEHQRTYFQRFLEYATDSFGRLGVVIAGNPNPVASALQPCKRVTVLIAQPCRAAAVMKAVTERDDTARGMVRDQGRQICERTRGVIRGKHLATGGETRAFLQMQIGHSQKPLLRPIERTARIREKRNSGQDNEIALALRQIWCRFAQLIASLTNSSAASASSVSPASPYTVSLPISSSTGTDSGETRSRAL